MRNSWIHNGNDKLEIIHNYGLKNRVSYQNQELKEITGLDNLVITCDKITIICGKKEVDNYVRKEI